MLGLAQAGSGCMALTPQLPPTDYQALEQVEDRQEREQLYVENTIYAHAEPQGMRYTKGTNAAATKRSWQSLDAVLRSDATASSALPTRQLRLSRLFTALTIVASIVTVAGAAASAREGLNLGELNGTGGLMLGGGLAALGFGISAGVFYGKAKKGYQNAVDVYNDSLGMRLGILDPQGEYIPPKGTLVDEQGRVMLELPEMAEDESSARGGAEAEAEPQPGDALSEPAPVEPGPVEAAPQTDPEIEREPAPQAGVEAAPEDPADPPAPAPEADPAPQPEPSTPSVPEPAIRVPDPSGTLSLRPRTSARRG